MTMTTSATSPSWVTITRIARHFSRNGRSRWSPRKAKTTSIGNGGEKTIWYQCYKQVFKAYVNRDLVLEKQNYYLDGVLPQFGLNFGILVINVEVMRNYLFNLLQTRFIL